MLAVSKQGLKSDQRFEVWYPCLVHCTPYSQKWWCLINVTVCFRKFPADSENLPHSTVQDCGDQQHWQLRLWWWVIDNLSHAMGVGQHFVNLRDLKVLFTHISLFKINLKRFKSLFYISNAAKENLALLLRRVQDSKTNVRKASLQVRGTDSFMFQNQRISGMHDRRACGKQRCTDDLLTSLLRCPSSGPEGSPEAWCDPHKLGEPGCAVWALQRPGCVCEEESTAVCGRAARGESQPAALRERQRASLPAEHRKLRNTDNKYQ